jgi:hypothetical protein
LLRDLAAPLLDSVRMARMGQEHPRVGRLIVEPVVVLNGELEFSAEFYLVVARLLLASAFHQVFECDFLAVHSHSMRKYSIAWDMVFVMFYQTKVSVSFIFDKTHRCANFGQGSKEHGRGEAGE